jgi:hypothetical protein
MSGVLMHIYAALILEAHSLMERREPLRRKTRVAVDPLRVASRVLFVAAAQDDHGSGPIDWMRRYLQRPAQQLGHGDATEHYCSGGFQRNETRHDEGAATQERGRNEVLA